MKTSKVFLNISSVVCFLYGAIYIFSLVFIPIGVYCFIAGRRFSYKAEHIDDFYTIKNEVFKNYVIFASIVCFPLGLLSIIPYVILTGNNVKISGLHLQEHDEVKVSDVQPETKENEVEDKDNSLVQEIPTEETETEKQEKFKKLQKFRDKGIITEEELEQAREQLFGDKKE